MQRILIVDDQQDILETYAMVLAEQYGVDTALGASDALIKLGSGVTYAVIISDMTMPGMNGAELLAKVRDRWPETVRVMLTGAQDQRTAVAAVNEGRIFRFINKPGSPEILLGALADAVSQHQLITAERELLEKTLMGSVQILTEMLALSDPQLLARTQLLRASVARFCEQRKIESPWEIDIAAMLLNIGAMTVPPEIILKSRRGQALVAAEQEMLRRIPRIGSDLLARIPRLEEAARIVLYQSKHFDGTGFPADEVAGAAIPIGARILKIAADKIQLELRGTSPAGSGKEMQNRIGWYDPDLLGLFTADTTESQTIAASIPVPFVKLRAGHKLISNVETLEGLTLVSAGYIITDILLERLQNFAASVGIKDPIYVEREGATLAGDPAT